MGYFLLWEIFRMSRVFTTTMLSRPVSSQHTAIKSDNIHLLQDVSLAYNEKEPLEQQNWGFCHNLSISVNFKNNSVFGDFTAS